jgi:hypothetical protein
MITTNELYFPFDTRSGDNQTAVCSRQTTSFNEFSIKAGILLRRNGGSLQYTKIFQHGWRTRYCSDEVPCISYSIGTRQGEPPASEKVPVHAFFAMQSMFIPDISRENPVCNIFLVTCFNWSNAYFSFSVILII